LPLATYVRTVARRPDFSVTSPVCSFSAGAAKLAESVAAACVGETRVVTVAHSFEDEGAELRPFIMFCLLFAVKQVVPSFLAGLVSLMIHVKRTRQQCPTAV